LDNGTNRRRKLKHENLIFTILLIVLTWLISFYSSFDYWLWFRSTPELIIIFSVFFHPDRGRVWEGGGGFGTGFERHRRFFKFDSTTPAIREKNRSFVHRRYKPSKPEKGKHFSVKLVGG
jgi:hypothetical protein